MAKVIARHDWAGPLAKALKGLWTDAYVVGWLSAHSLLAHHGVAKADAPAATVSIGVDWGSWTPGDTDAAKQILGRNDALGHLLSLVDTGDTVADQIVVNRMDRLAGVLIDGLEKGLAPDAIARQLASVLGDKQWAHLVALTETTRAVSEASLQSYARNGVEAKEWMTAEDQRVCARCAGNEDQGAIPLDGVFPDGSDAPPGHPLCRCSIAPAWLTAEEAAAQGADLTGLGGSLVSDEELAQLTTSTVAYPALADEGTVTGDEALAQAPIHFVGISSSATVEGGNLSAAERTELREALRTYVSGSFKEIGLALREVAGAHRPDYLDRLMRDFDDAMAKSKLGRNVEVWRGLREGGLFADRLAGDLTGFEWTDRSYVSTMTKPEVSRFSRLPGGDESVVLHLTVPQGTGALALDAENELLLDRGLSFRVTADHGMVDGSRLLDVEVVPARAAALAGEGGTATREMTQVTVRDELQAAKSAQQVSKVFTDQARQITGRDIPSEFRGSVQTAREHAEGLLRGLERFPEADLFKVEAVALDKSAYAEAEGGVMRFNTAFTSDRQIYLRALRKDVDTHWHPAGMDNPAGIALHEFGHILDIETLGEVARDDIEHIVEDTAAGAGVNVEQLIKFDVSRYAFDGKELELAAEAFADVMLNGGEASQLSRDIYAELRKAYEAGGRTFTSTARVRAGAMAEGRLTLTALRAQAREAGIRGFSRMSRDQLEAALRPTATAVERAAMTPAEFEAKAADAAKGNAAMEAAKVQAQIQAAGSDSATWKATGFSGVEGSVPNGTAAVTQYLRGPGFINDRLRFPDGRPVEPGWPVPTAERAAKDATKADKYVTALDKLMAQSPLETDAVVWRGLRLADIGLTDDVGVGFEWTDPGFVSTAGRRGIAENDFAQSGQAALVRILVPRGTGALGFEGLGESELLLDRNLTFRVVADNGRTEITSFSGKKLQGARLLDVEIVPKVAAAPVAETAAAQDLSRMTVTQLRAVAKDRGLTGYSKLTKPQLLERLAGEAQPVETTPALNAQQVAAADRRAALEAATKKDTGTFDQRLYGGLSADTRVLGTGDDAYVLKRYGSRYSMTASELKEATDAEVLGPQILDAMGGRGAATIRTGKGTVAVEFLDGVHYDSYTASAAERAEIDRLAATDDGRVAGLMSYITGHADLNDGNWIAMADGRVGVFDFPGIFGGSYGVDEVPFNTFTEYLRGDRIQFRVGEGYRLADRIDWNPADLAVIRQRLEALRPTFAAAKRTNWFKTMMQRLAEAEKRADPTAPIRLG